VGQFSGVAGGSVLRGLTTSAVATDEPAPPEISAGLRKLAQAAEGNPADPPTDELRKARAVAEPLVARAEDLDNARQEAEAALKEARSQLASAQNQADRAQENVRFYTRQVAQEAARQAEQAARCGRPAGERWRWR